MPPIAADRRRAQGLVPRHRTLSGQPSTQRAGLGQHRARLAAVGARDLPLPNALSPRARPPASPPPATAPPPAPPLGGTQLRASCLQSRRRAGYSDRTPQPAVSLGARAPSLLPSPGCPEPRSAGHRCSTALPMAQPESRLRGPDLLDRSAAQVSGKTPGAPGAPTWSPGLSASSGLKVSRSWSKCSECRGTRKERRDFSILLASCPTPRGPHPQLCKSGGTVYSLLAGLRVSDYSCIGWCLP